MKLVPVLMALVVTVALVGGVPGGRVVDVHAQQPGSQPAAGPPVPLVDRARQDLARRLGLSASQVTVAEASPMTWTSLALGCPAPGLAYAAVETPGFSLALDAFGQRYTYHTDTRETFVLCLQGQGVSESQVLSASGLMAALLERGLRVEVADAYAELPFLRADGTRYRLSGASLAAPTEIQLYDYRDPATLAEDVARIGPDGQPASGRVDWARPPRFFRSGSVLALAFDGYQPLVDLLTDLLGPPFHGAVAPESSPPPPASPPPGGLPPSPPPPGSGIPSSFPPTDPSVLRVSWDEAKALITSGKVKQAFQTHALEVRLSLKDGGSVVTTETRIDEVFQVIRACGAPCSDIMIATE